MSASRPLLRCTPLVLAALLAACGNKGPLYKPTPPAQPASPAQPQPAPPGTPPAQVPAQDAAGH